MTSCQIDRSTPYSLDYRVRTGVLITPITSQEADPAPVFQAQQSLVASSEAELHANYVALSIPPTAQLLSTMRKEQSLSLGIPLFLTPSFQRARQQPLKHTSHYSSIDSHRKTHQGARKQEALHV
jgi:hypothetical protein